MEHYTPQQWAHLEQRQRAYAVFHQALRSGTIVRPDCCSECGEAGYISGHHQNHAFPLEVDWVCGKCHAKRRIESIVAREVGPDEWNIIHAKAKSDGVDISTLVLDFVRDWADLR